MAVHPVDRMTVTVLGSGTCVPVPGRAAPGCLLRIAATPVLVDPGPGALARMAAEGGSYRDLGLVLISHLHPDHTLDLVTLLQANNSTPGFHRSRPLLVAGCEGLSSFVARLAGLFDGLAPEGYPMEVREIGPGAERYPPGWTLSCGPSGHAPGSLCFRFEHGNRAFVYSGDASTGGELARLARGADLLLCECSLPDGWDAPGHLTAGQAGAIAREAGVGRLVLTHLYPPALEADVVAQARAAYGGPVSLASDGWTVAV